VRRFEYHVPEDIGEALALLAEYGPAAALMAGGTALVLFMRQGLLRPAHVIGLHRLSALHGTAREADGALRLNALMTIGAAARAPEVRTHSAALAEAFGRVATIRIRNQATVGGNLAHADPASDPPVMLIALGAEAILAGRGGERRVPLDSFFVDTFTTTLAEDEILMAVRVPLMARGTRARYVKFTPRTADDYGTVTVGAALLVDPDGRVADARIALGCVGRTPLRAHGAENVLRGERPSPSLLAEAAAAAGDRAEPLDDVRGSAAYKKEMVRVWTQRVLRDLLSP
jgi:carbon-monoxide dehydrogenase medium subunit